MKKLMFGLAALAAGSVMAIESANIVGYTTKEITTGNYNIVAVPFAGIGDAGFQLNNENSFKVVNPTASTTYSAADQVQIWDPVTSGYDVFYFRSTSAGWNKYGTRSTKFEAEYPDGLVPGSTFWYLSQENADASSTTDAGQVDDAATIVMDDLVAGNYNLLASPFPMPLSLNNASQIVIDGAFASTTYSAADQIQIWDPVTSGYDVFYFRSTSAGWNKYGTRSTKFEAEYPDGLPIGEGFWYLSNGSEAPVITFTSPITK